MAERTGIHHRVACASPTQESVAQPTEVGERPGKPCEGKALSALDTVVGVRRFLAQGCWYGMGLTMARSIRDGTGVSERDAGHSIVVSVFTIGLHPLRVWGTPWDDGDRVRIA